MSREWALVILQETVSFETPGSSNRAQTLTPRTSYRLQTQWQIIRMYDTADTSIDHTVSLSLSIFMYIP